MNEFSQKIHRIRDLAASYNLDGILLQSPSSFAWMTCGASAYVNIASSESVASLLITPDKLYLITNNIEAARLEKEEELAAQGWDFCTDLWYKAEHTIPELTRGLRIGTDKFCPEAFDLTHDIAHLRANLTPEEGERFRTLGKFCAQAITSTARSIHPGQTEYEIAALLASEAQRHGVQATVNLIATDERIFHFRHPLPTEKKLDRYAMLILCGRKQGLVCSVTRLVYFGVLPAEIRRKAEAVAQLDATLIAATRPGRKLGDIFQRAIEMYASLGYPDEWKLHHQGGPAGYEPREYLALPDSSESIAPGQVYAWNPSITGVKSEDTILIGEETNDILTETDDWPTINVQIYNQIIKRPVILERETL
jgi:Xaa-Pro aminopeptidase